MIRRRESMRQQQLFELLKEAVSPYQCVDKVKKDLLSSGFIELSYEKNWKLQPGESYVVNHHDTTLFAFTVGKDYRKSDMLRMAAAHTDYPCLRLKPNPDFQTDSYAQVNVEVYGGPILNTWLDRPLGVAGRVAVKSGDVFAPQMMFYRSKEPVMMIPNLAIHMNREVNKGVEINPQTDLMPIVELLSEEEKTTDYFLTFLAAEIGVDKSDILDFELNTFCMDEARYVGPKKTMISSPRLDNQTSVFALESAVLEGQRAQGINLIAIFDHEEIGSNTKQGADSILLHDLCRRMLRSLGLSEDEIDSNLYHAMLLSVDVAHALHPNHKGKMDIIHHPRMGKGFCIKEASGQTYATDAQAIGILCQLCEKYRIPYQRFVNRSDIRGGQTLGSMASALLPVKTVDLGVPILAMHSACELMGAADLDALTDAVTAYFRE